MQHFIRLVFLPIAFLALAMGDMILAGGATASMRTSQVVEPKLIRLDVETNTTSINLGHKAQLTLTGTYENNSTKTLTGNIQWITTPNDAVEISGTVPTVLKDTNATLRASFVCTLHV